MIISHENNLQFVGLSKIDDAIRLKWNEMNRTFEAIDFFIGLSFHSLFDCFFSANHRKCARTNILHSPNGNEYAKKNALNVTVGLSRIFQLLFDYTLRTHSTTQYDDNMIVL